MALSPTSAATQLGLPQESLLFQAAEECGLAMSVADARKLIRCIEGSPVLARHRGDLETRQVPRLSFEEERELIHEIQRADVQVASAGLAVAAFLATLGVVLVFNKQIFESAIFKQHVKPAWDKFSQGVSHEGVEQLMRPAP